MAWKIIKGLFIGLFLGMVSSVGLYILGFCIEILNCTCHIITCNCNGGDAMPFMWSWESFRNTFFATSVGGTVIGTIYGIVSGLQEKNEKIAAWKKEQELLALKHRQENAKQLKQEVEKQCENIESMVESVHSHKLICDYQNISDSNEAYKVLKDSYSDNAVLKKIVEECQGCE